MWSSPGTLNRSPCTAVPGQQVGCFGRSITPGRISVDRVGVGRPGIEDRLYHCPASLNVVSALEQHGIPDHAVVDKRFVTCAWGYSEVILVREIHVDPFQAHRRTGDLGVKFQRYS